MKVKLLKKIRKRYSIVYYEIPPISASVNWNYWHYAIEKRNNFFYWSFKETKQDCIDTILYEVRKKYAKYSRKYRKPNYNGVKVWYNK